MRDIVEDIIDNSTGWYEDHPVFLLWQLYELPLGTGFYPTPSWAKQAKKLVADGLAEYEGPCLRITSSGLSWISSYLQFGWPSE